MDIGELGMGGWFVVGSIVFMLYKLAKSSKAKAAIPAAIPYAQAIEDLKQETERLQNPNQTSKQREHRLQEFSIGPVRADGIVNDVTTTNYGARTEIVVDVDGFGQVTCHVVGEHSLKKADSLSKGQKVSLLGTVDRYSVGHFWDMHDKPVYYYSLKDASLVDPS